MAAYGAAWARAAARWLPALAALPELARAPGLPHKIVFSVVVVSARPGRGRFILASTFFFVL